MPFFEGGHETVKMRAGGGIGSEVVKLCRVVLEVVKFDEERFAAEGVWVHLAEDAVGFGEWFLHAHGLAVDAVVMLLAAHGVVAAADGEEVVTGAAVTLDALRRSCATFDLDTRVVSAVETFTQEVRFNASARLVDLGHAALAASQLGRAESLFARAEAHVDVDTRGAWQAGLAELYLRRGQLARARSAAQEALAEPLERTSRGELRLIVAEAAARAGRREEAIGLARAAQQELPRMSAAHRRRLAAIEAALRGEL